MFWLRLPEGTSRGDFGDNLSWPQTRSVHIGNRFFRDPLLFIAGVIDTRSVACAAIIALTVHRSWVVDLKEKFENLAIAGYMGVKGDFNRFGVRAVVAIRCVGHIAA
jgi:hypothetical protein